MYNVISLGEILIDFTSQGRNEQGQRLFAQNAGGAPANVAVAVARLGGKSAFIGKAGDDMHGRFLKSTLEEKGVDCTALVLDGEREFSFARKHGADKMLTKDEIPTQMLENSRIFHFGSVSLTDEPSRSATLYGAEKARENGVTVAYDPNYRASLWQSEEKAREEMRNAAAFADLIKISDEETVLLTDEADCEKAAEKLIENGAVIVVVTLGKDGAYVRTRDGGKFVSGFSVNAVDCTGAGDAFWGGFLLKVSQCGKTADKITLSEAAEFARFSNAVASLCVENCGAIPSMPTIETVKKRLL